MLKRQQLRAARWNGVRLVTISRSVGGRAIKCGNSHLIDFSDINCWIPSCTGIYNSVIITVRA